MSARRGNKVDQFTGTAKMNLYIILLVTLYFMGLFRLISYMVSWKEPCNVILIMGESDRLVRFQTIPNAMPAQP